MKLNVFFERQQYIIRAEKYPREWIVTTQELFHDKNDGDYTITDAGETTLRRLMREDNGDLGLYVAGMIFEQCSLWDDYRPNDIDLVLDKPIEIFEGTFTPPPFPTNFVNTFANHPYYEHPHQCRVYVPSYFY